MSTVSPTPAGALMAAEIAEQPHTLAKLLGNWEAAPPVIAESLLPAFRSMHHLLLSGCGSSLHAAHATAFALTSLAGIGAVARPAHELIELTPTLWRTSEGIVLFGQSGETHDTLEALRLATTYGCPQLAICSAPDSPLATASRWALDTFAGSERAIPSTKGYLGQHALGLLFALALSEAKEPPYAPYGAHHRNDSHRNALFALPAALAALLDDEALEDDIQHAAHKLADARHVIFLGAGTSEVSAREGALKLKESALIPAYATTPGELKHGPIAMLEPEDAVVLMLPPKLSAPASERLEALIARLMTLGVHLVCVCEPEAWHTTLAALRHQALLLNVAGAHSGLVWPLLATSVLQRLALATARVRNVDPDRPRRLVKSIQDHLPRASQERISP